MTIKITDNEKAVLEDLLEVALGEWFSTEVLPNGIKSVEEANRTVESLLYKLNPDSYYKKNHITTVSGIGIQKP